MAAQRPETRPRSRSLMSFGSHRSSGSIPKIDKADLVESPKEKSARKMQTKADPTMAISEAQPAAQALEKSTMESIRNLQHRDRNGNIITDPDRSNPTRPRLERPLDTIRSFEAAIDGSYSKRFSTRAEPADPTLAQSRRSSYFMGYNNVSAPQRFPGDSGGYYGNRTSYSRPDSYVENGSNQAGQYTPRQPRQFGPRNNSDPALYGNNSYMNNGYSNGGNQNQVYPTHGYQQSYDTVTTSASGSGSHGTDQWGTSTDPSSENSSIDKIQPVQKPDLAEVYGFSGFGGAPQFQGPILEEFHQGSPEYGQPGYGQGNQQAYQGNGVPPPPPRHGVAPKEIPPRVPLKASAPPGRTMYGNGNYPVRQDSQADAGEKRKGWLKRRFSRNG